MLFKLLVRVAAGFCIAVLAVLSVAVGRFAGLTSRQTSTVFVGLLLLSLGVFWALILSRLTKKQRLAYGVAGALVMRSVAILWWVL
jgi:uncharacterized membrane protein YcfT